MTPRGPWSQTERSTGVLCPSNTHTFPSLPNLTLQKSSRQKAQPSSVSLKSSSSSLVPGSRSSEETTTRIELPTKEQKAKTFEESSPLFKGLAKRKRSDELGPDEDGGLGRRKVVGKKKKVALFVQSSSLGSTVPREPSPTPSSTPRLPSLQNQQAHPTLPASHSRSFQYEPKSSSKVKTPVESAPPRGSRPTFSNGRAGFGSFNPANFPPTSTTTSNSFTFLLDGQDVDLTTLSPSLEKQAFSSSGRGGGGGVRSGRSNGKRNSRSSQMGGGRGGDRGRVGEGRRGRAQGAGGLGSMAEEDVKDESNSHLPSQLGAGSTGGGASGGVGSEATSRTTSPATESTPQPPPTLPDQVRVKIHVPSAEEQTQFQFLLHGTTAIREILRHLSNRFDVPIERIKLSSAGLSVRHGVLGIHLSPPFETLELDVDFEQVGGGPSEPTVGRSSGINSKAVASSLKRTITTASLDHDPNNAPKRSRKTSKNSSPGSKTSKVGKSENTSSRKRSLSEKEEEEEDSGDGELGAAGEDVVGSSRDVKGKGKAKPTGKRRKVVVEVGDDDEVGEDGFDPYDPSNDKYLIDVMTSDEEDGDSDKDDEEEDSMAINLDDIKTDLETPTSTNSNGSAVGEPTPSASSSSTSAAPSSPPPRTSQIKRSPGAHFDRDAFGWRFEEAASHHKEGKAFLLVRDRIWSGEHLASAEKKAKLEAVEGEIVEELNGSILWLDSGRTREEFLRDPTSVDDDGIRLQTTRLPETASPAVLNFNEWAPEESFRRGGTNGFGAGVRDGVELAYSENISQSRGHFVPGVAFLDVSTSVYPVGETGKKPYLKSTKEHLQLLKDDYRRTLGKRLDGSSLSIHNGKVAYETFFLPLSSSKAIQSEVLVVPIPVEIVDGEGRFVRDDVVDFPIVLAAKNDQELKHGSFMLSLDHQCALQQFSSGIKVAKADVSLGWIRELSPRNLTYDDCPLDFHAREFPPTLPDGFGSSPGERHIRHVSYLAKEERDSGTLINLQELELEKPTFVNFVKQHVSKRADLVPTLNWPSSTPLDVRGSIISQSDRLMTEKAMATRTRNIALRKMDSSTLDAEQKASLAQSDDRSARRRAWLDSTTSEQRAEHRQREREARQAKLDAMNEEQRAEHRQREREARQARWDLMTEEQRAEHRRREREAYQTLSGEEKQELIKQKRSKEKPCPHSDCSENADRLYAPTDLDEHDLLDHKIGSNQLRWRCVVCSGQPRFRTLRQRCDHRKTHKESHPDLSIEKMFDDTGEFPMEDDFEGQRSKLERSIVSKGTTRGPYNTKLNPTANPSRLKKAVVSKGTTRGPYYTKSNPRPKSSLSCPECTIPFTKSGNLKRHRSRAHGVGLGTPSAASTGRDAVVSSTVMGSSSLSSRSPRLELPSSTSSPSPSSSPSTSLSAYPISYDPTRLPTPTPTPSSSFTFTPDRVVDFRVSHLRTSPPTANDQSSSPSIHDEEREPEPAWSGWRRRGFDQDPETSGTDSAFTDGSMGDGDRWEFTVNLAESDRNEAVASLLLLGSSSAPRQLKSFDPSFAQPSLGENGQPDVLSSQELLVDASMEESFPRNEENALMTRCSPSQKIVKTQRRVFPSHHCRRLEAVQELEERAEVSERLPSLERVARALELSPTMDELEEPRIKEEFKNIESAEEIDEGSGEDELEEESTGIAQGYISSSFARRSSHAQESLLQLRAQAPPQPSFPLRINPQSSSEPDAQHRRLSTPSPLRKTSAILVSSRTPSSFDLLQSPPSPPSAISQSSSDPTPRQPKDGAASSSIKPPFLFARQASRVCTPPPLRSSPTQTANPSSIQAIGLAQPAPTAPPTPSLVNSNRKRPFDPALLAPSKKRRSDHVSFLLPNDKENEHEAAMPSPTEVDLKGCKIVIGADVQDEQTREQLEEDVEALDGEISVRAVREDWEDDGEGIQVVLICWETSEGAEGSPAAREEVELARETGACLHDPLWVSSLMEVLEERKSPSKSKQRRSKGRWLYKR